jgi:hypothetical protein
MSDVVVQAIVGGVFAVIVALINKRGLQWGMDAAQINKPGVHKPKKIDAKGENKEGEAVVPKKLSFMKTGTFVWIIAPIAGASLGLVLFLTGFNGVRAVAGTGPVPLKAPFSISGYFYPSGFMGDTKQIEMNAHWTGNCHVGPTCMRFKYTPGGGSWAGVYWQSPANNWGDQPGRRIEGAKKLVFWARGESGGELVSFRTGGIQGKKYQDSLDRVMNLDPVQLTAQWKQYQIDLDGVDTNSVIGAFSWSIARDSNPAGATFYLEGISFE